MDTHTKTPIDDFAREAQTLLEAVYAEARANLSDFQLAVVVAMPFLFFWWICCCNFAGRSRGGRRSSRLHKHAIADKFTSIEQVQNALMSEGLESSNLILGIDYTRSNEHNGQRSNNGLSLHHMFYDGRQNPYERVIDILGRTLEKFDDDGEIPAYGFGDSKTSGHSVFSLRRKGPCQGFREVLSQYREVTPTLHLSGPTSFAPLIRKAIEIVRSTRQYHILVIICDGQVNDGATTKKAIIEASEYPLSIVVVGVGDANFNLMHQYDDELPGRKFDNFQFVHWDSREIQGADFIEPAFALQALMELPDQYAYCKRYLFEEDEAEKKAG